jgi:hypothetical protein
MTTMTPAARIAVGAVTAAIGGYVWLRTQAANNVCSSILGALDARDCQTVTLWHTGSALAALAGIALAAWGIYARRPDRDRGAGR